MLPDHYQDKTWGSCDSVKELLTGAPEAVRMTPLSSGGAILIPVSSIVGLLAKRLSIRTPALGSAIWRASPNW
jgi:hypothetical protein